MGRLDGKVIVVTGGGRGFGRAYCIGLSREGATVVIAEHNEDTALQTQAAVEELGGRAMVHVTDVRDESTVLAMRDSVARDLGGVDGLINNAGIMPQIYLDDITREVWDDIYATNVWGSFICARAVAPLMERRGGGSIVNVASSTVLRPPQGHVAYQSSKGAVVALTRSLATDLADQNIRVNAIIPALTPTPGVLEDAREGFQEYLESRVQLQLIKRPSRAEDVVGAAIFLLSEDSSFVTGQCLPVNAGLGMV